MIEHLKLNVIRNDFDGLVVAADVLANSLNHLFRNRTPDELFIALNVPEAVSVHPLAQNLDSFRNWDGYNFPDTFYLHPKDPTRSQQPSVGKPPMTPTIFIVPAGLMGAAGVILAAAGAHAAPGAGLDSAARMLLFHAAALPGGTVLLQQGVLSRPPALIALTGWVLGAALFCGDIALRAFVVYLVTIPVGRCPNSSFGQTIRLLSTGMSR